MREVRPVTREKVDPKNRIQETDSKASQWQHSSLQILNRFSHLAVTEWHGRLISIQAFSYVLHTALLFTFRTYVYVMRTQRTNCIKPHKAHVNLFHGFLLPSSFFRFNRLHEANNDFYRRNDLTISCSSYLSIEKGYNIHSR